MLHEKNKDVLKNIPLFKELTEAEIEQIQDIAKEQNYKPDEHVFLQSEPLTHVFFVLHGEVKIYKTDIEGKEQIVNILRQGDMFPHQGFFRNDLYPAHAEITEATKLLAIPKERFENFLTAHPTIMIKIFKVLGDIIVDLQNRLEEQILHNTQEQIMMLLLRLVDKYGMTSESNSLILLSKKFSNRELANMIGSSRETVSRTLSSLRRKKLVSVDEKHNWLIDKEGLEEFLFDS
ncbi:Crp/Fnr family transcriptional regulator [Saliterribacillus persicus]|uniref:CRP/FNR family transcriptional regulator n=1 Tax=Saliterribacillus persicus TaxID=930114 RepID=A0A368XUL8_9BACI|nr:Crp/Fnr family transcriptional regulator [Saliterribacillus persicus]RCW69724.1 CRP/FNR family transcriptional regulator [Saliterribacillus persicus]